MLFRSFPSHDTRGCYSVHPSGYLADSGFDFVYPYPYPYPCCYYPAGSAVAAGTTLLPPKGYTWFPCR